ncbi:HEAT repeat domain-containing protein [Draconibacterium sp. IB214405]|uniref:HEAT repeat domain-containing protein n=1 Tax=Draconibacterium sp. IB214405 TaxID=3097352 RepID=UPI002A153052|nr:HEAT repeat domain-containing protein [Draconibacterium sp. IB214405]MDX8339235.1 HEAT repeat domain-containing protein [Draconibacterium sp. IB214405]
MNKTKISETIKKELFSAETDKVLAAINTLKEKGNKDYLPILFELMLTDNDAQIEKELQKLLGTIKDKETIPVFINALQEDKYKSIRKKVLTVCWQNGLDYSEYIEVFVNLIISEEWETAFEAFTVIENMEHFPSPEVMKPLKLKVAGALKVATDQRAYLLEEFLKLST